MLATWTYYVQCLWVSALNLTLEECAVRETHRLNVAVDVATVEAIVLVVVLVVLAVVDAVIDSSLLIAR